MNRMGALRVKTELNGPFLNNNTRLAVPPLSSLRELEFSHLDLIKLNTPSNKKSAKCGEICLTAHGVLGYQGKIKGYDVMVIDARSTRNITFDMFV